MRERTMTFPACPCVVKIAQSEKVDQTVIRRLLFKCRLFVFLASNGKRFVEILAVEPRFVPHVFQQALFPNPRGLDIEFALQLPINRLDPLAGDSPLSAHPVDVAMQGHRSVLPKKLTLRRKPG